MQNLWPCLLALLVTNQVCVHTLRLGADSDAELEEKETLDAQYDYGPWAAPVGVGGDAPNAVAAADGKAAASQSQAAAAAAGPGAQQQQQPQSQLLQEQHQAQQQQQQQAPKQQQGQSPQPSGQKQQEQKQQPLQRRQKASRGTTTTLPTVPESLLQSMKAASRPGSDDAAALSADTMAALAAGLSASEIQAEVDAAAVADGRPAFDPFAPAADDSDAAHGRPVPPPPVAVPAASDPGMTSRPTADLASFLDASPTTSVEAAMSLGSALSSPSLVAAPPPTTAAPAAPPATPLPAPSPAALPAPPLEPLPASSPAALASASLLAAATTTAMASEKLPVASQPSRDEPLPVANAAAPSVSPKQLLPAALPTPGSAEPLPAAAELIGLLGDTAPPLPLPVQATSAPPGGSRAAARIPQDTLGSQPPLMADPGSTYASLADAGLMAPAAARDDLALLARSPGLPTLQSGGASATLASMLEASAGATTPLPVRGDAAFMQAVASLAATPEVDTTTPGAGVTLPPLLSPDGDPKTPADGGNSTPSNVTREAGPWPAVPSSPAWTATTPPAPPEPAADSQASSTGWFKYLLAARGSNVCGANGRFIERPDDCKEAALQLGLDFRGVEMSSIFPVHCYAWSGPGPTKDGVFYNTHAAGNSHRFGRPLCESLPPPPPPPPPPTTPAPIVIYKEITKVELATTTEAPCEEEEECDDDETSTTAAATTTTTTPACRPRPVITTPACRPRPSSTTAKPTVNGASPSTNDLAQFGRELHDLLNKLKTTSTTSASTTSTTVTTSTSSTTTSSQVSSSTSSHLIIHIPPPAAPASAATPLAAVLNVSAASAITTTQETVAPVGEPGCASSPCIITTTKAKPYCDSPVNVTNGHPERTCEEGDIVPFGDICTAKCAANFKPSVKVLKCVDGTLSPPTFTCEAPKPCPVRTTPCPRPAQPCQRPQQGPAGTNAMSMPTAQQQVGSNAVSLLAGESKAPAKTSVQVVPRPIQDPAWRDLEDNSHAVDKVGIQKDPAFFAIDPVWPSANDISERPVQPFSWHGGAGL
eukprot:TRINITY_DN29896_c0_g1_i3.p1 TRINITY_DN29896_c0_g1~~TRINITY_DN29896_c0_g1_i3.p1  ORF type:complete len:1049 (-),score=219.20 TRINITY_DN29896_c0_g1_i3:146-3292(-)